MAYVPGFLHDVFISYACADDKQDGLIQHFYTLLANAVGAEGLRIKEEGGAEEGVEVFLDRRAIEAGSDLTEQVLTSARSTAVFIAIHSPAYLESAWCQREAEEFVTNYDPRRPNLNGRLFVTSLSKRGGPPESKIAALRSRRFRRFFYEMDGKDFPFDPLDAAKKNSDGFTLKEEAKLLADEVAKTLKAMREESPAPRVFLAETSSARAPHAEDIKKWLVQKQVIVLRVSGRGDGWEAQSRALIGRADLFVDIHEAEPTPAGVRQASLATELGKPRARWLPRGELGVDEAPAAMKETRLVEETLEDFKTSLQSLLVQPSERHRPAADQAPPGADPSVLDAMVLLVGASKDKDCLVQVEKKLDEIGCGRDSFVTEDVIENPDLWRTNFQGLIELHDPNSVVFVDGQCAGSWRDVRLRDLLLLVRDAAPMAKAALCVFPPPDKPDRRLNPRPSQVTRIEYSNLDKLKDLLGV